MKEVLLGERIEPMKLLGAAIKVYLKAGAKFHFKITGAGVDYISGFDCEGLELLIHLNDVDFVITQ